MVQKCALFHTVRLSVLNLDMIRRLFVLRFTHPAMHYWETMMLGLEQDKTAVSCYSLLLIHLSKTSRVLTQ